MILEHTTCAAEYADTYMHPYFLKFVFLAGKMGSTPWIDRQYFGRFRTCVSHTIRARPLLKPLSL